MTLQASQPLGPAQTVGAGQVVFPCFYNIRLICVESPLRQHFTLKSTQILEFGAFNPLRRSHWCCWCVFYKCNRAFDHHALIIIRGPCQHRWIVPPDRKASRDPTDWRPESVLPPLLLFELLWNVSNGNFYCSSLCHLYSIVSSPQLFCCDWILCLRLEASLGSQRTGLVCFSFSLFSSHSLFHFHEKKQNVWVSDTWLTTSDGSCTFEQGLLLLVLCLWLFIF